MDPEVRAMSAMTALAAVNYTTTVLCEVWCPQATLLTQAEEPRSMLEDTPDRAKVQEEACLQASWER